MNINFNIMAELKTRENDGDVLAFLNSVENEKRRTDSLDVLEMMKEITGETPKMWGENIVGFGHYDYKYASGRTGTWLCVGFSPRKSNLTIYLLGGFSANEAVLEKLGRHKKGKSCLYIRKLEDVDLAVLHDLIEEAYHYIKNKEW